jgi:HAMP domain-containing protein
MRLLAKFSLIFVAVFGVGLGAAAFFLRGMLQRSARDQVLYQAELMMETALAMRSYTAEQVAPALVEESKARTQDPSADEVFRDLCTRKGFGTGKRVFRPQRVPAYAATEMFGYLRKRYPEYAYKEAALNPTAPRDRAVDWEEDLLKDFRANPEKKPVAGERDTPLGRSLYLARPMRIDASKGCLLCHSTPSAAPPEFVQLYGPANGFGWNDGEVVAAQIVSVPSSLPGQMADRAFRWTLGMLLVVGLVTLVILDTVLYLTVIRPVATFAGRADEISKGQLDVPELPVKGKDEISMLAAAFNRMHRSMSTAMKMLEKEP